MIIDSHVTSETIMIIESKVDSEKNYVADSKADKEIMFQEIQGLSLI